MMYFTDEAVAHIRKSLVRFPGGGFRVSIKKSGCSGYKYVPEVVAGPKEGDVEWVTEQGLRVFVDLPGVMKEVRVDLETRSLGQKQLVFHNPNVIHECGCGESFQIPSDADG
jgi:iron-sulfur cluster assembly accessory protein